MHGLVDGPETAGAQLLEKGVLARGVAARDGVWVSWPSLLLDRGGGLGLLGSIVSTPFPETRAGRH
jgi:hypothetical protein